MKQLVQLHVKLKKTKFISLPNTKKRKIMRFCIRIDIEINTNYLKNLYRQVAYNSVNFPT